MGENIILYDHNAIIVESNNPDFLTGNSAFDYIHRRHHKEIRKVMRRLPRTKDQPVPLDFDVLSHGHWHPRRAEIYYCLPGDMVPEGGYLCIVADRPVSHRVVDFADFLRSTENQFTVSPGGIILACAHPERTLIDPVGVSIYDVLLPKYKHRIRGVMRWVLRKEIERPVEYIIKVGGERRYEKGTIRPSPPNVIFHVVRMAMPKHLDRDKPG